MADVEPFEVEVAYARLDVQVIVAVRVERGDTAADAIRRSGILERFAEIDSGSLKVGVFSRIVPLTHPLSPGDRVEIYRQLVADPKEARKQRVRERQQNPGRG
jgi:putative ubiquitin-RnfH superfamily antitoxin RatB of RatAB toxin-antitoxin module